MDGMYLYAEYGKVFIAYAVLYYVWPCIMFRRYLKGRGPAYRFMFCGTVQVLLINCVVLGLGIFHLLKPWAVRGLFWGALALSVGAGCAGSVRRGTFMSDPLIRNFLSGVCGWKMFLARIFDKPLNTLRRDRGKRMELILLTAVIAFGMAYFSRGAFQFASYGTSDEFIHHTWIMGLSQGNIFADGIYPQAMHCFIYGMNTLFGTKIYYGILFLAGIYSSAFLLSIYLLLKEVFQYRFTPLFVLIAFLTFDASNGQALEAMGRLTWTLPQEFGLYLIFLCPLFLIRFFRKEGFGQGEGKLKAREWYQDENLLLLMAGVGAALSIHFYVLILAFFSCLAVALVHFGKILSRSRIRLLASAVFYGMEAGGVPMVVAYVMGMEPEGSLGWGLDTIQGISQEAVKQENVTLGSERDFLRGLYESGPARVLGEEAGRLLICLFGALLITACVCKIISLLGRKRGRRVLSLERMADGYFFALVASGIFVFLYAMPYVGLQEIVANERLFGIVELFVLLVFGGAADFLFLMLERSVKQSIVRGLAYLTCAAIYCFAYLTDFHEYSHWWMRRYAASTFVTERILNNLPENSYTIVSTDEELFQIMEKGRHEELLDFVKGLGRTEYFIPTEYVFLYVEKQAISYGQDYFCEGPSWLAGENVHAAIRREEQLLYPKISEEAAEEMPDYFPEAIDNYRDMDIRNVLNSKAFVWYRDFSEAYPAETNIYYEDDRFICYMIHQNPHFLLNLSMEDH